MAKKKTSQKSTTRKSTRSRKSRPQEGLLRRALRWCLVAGLWGFIALSLVIAWYGAELPKLIDKPDFERKAAITIRDDRGEMVARYGELKGVNVTVAELPPDLIHAVLAIEDRRFYYHFGIDPIGMLRATARNITAGRVVQGGSTITQQLAKNLFLSRERTYKRKIQEAMLAVWLEQKLTKDEILSAYLNRVYLGAGTFGVEAAAQTYFNKSAREMNLRESATIAGLLKAPSKYSPHSNPSLARERADTVIMAMRDAGYLSDSESKGATEQAPAPLRKPTGGDIVRYYSDWVMSDLADMIGTPNTDLIVDTTLDAGVQRAAEEALTKALRNEDAAEKKVSQGAIVVMDYSGAVLAMVGGTDYGLSQFNRAVQSYRQPGSSFKPIVYLTALENGMNRNSIVVDEPIRTGKYRPTNFKGEYYGEIPLYAALAYSLNTIAYQLTKHFGVDSVIDMARRLGIEAPLNRDLSLSLGSAGIPLIQMVSAYATIGNQGSLVQPYAIRRVRDKDGRLIYERSSRIVRGRSVVDPRLTQELAGMMTGVLEFGTGQGAKVPYPAAGKTGTSQEFRDAWFIGFTDTYIAGVWVGNDDNTSMKRVTGGSYPARIWRETIMGAYNARGGGGFMSSLSPAPVTEFDPNAENSSDSAFGDLISNLLSAPATNDQPRTGIFGGSTYQATRANEEGRKSDWSFND